jgi:glycolate oxidase FAD binding subunit
MSDPFIHQLQEQIKTAQNENRSLQVIGHGSKVPLASDCEAVSLAGYSGIVEYEPSELVVTVKAGTTLKELQAALAEHNQTLGFEPPDYGNSTIGGTYACALTGPSRPFRGVLRDFVLGIKMVDGRGQTLQFGGKMIKNVAGYDVARMLSGSKGGMGVVTEISFKVSPLYPETTYQIEMSEDDAIQMMNRMAGTTAPLTGCAYYQGHFYYRLYGAHPKQAATPTSNDIWITLNPFQPDLPPETKLWRVDTEGPAPSIPNTLAVGMCGQRRWVISDEAPSEYATLWQNYFAPRDRDSAPIKKLKQGLKSVFDPNHLFKML